MTVWQVLLLTLGLALQAQAGFFSSLCSAVTRRLDRSYEFGGIYLRTFPLGRCNPINLDDIYFKVYPRKCHYDGCRSSINTPNEQIFLEDDPERLRSYFNYSLPTAIYTHGFFEGEKGSSIRAFRAAFIHRGDYNFIAVDWQKPAAGPWYLSASNNIVPVGRALAKLLDRLIAIKAIRLDTLHLIGFSLGAHVSSIAANHMTSGRVPRITGLDPAYPTFPSRSMSVQLDKSDADFVDVIHTCGGFLGFARPLGHVDFYPNGGSFVQPGCVNVISFGTCSHWRSWRFFEESLRGGEFVGTACSSYDDYLNNRCKRNQKNLMGLYTNTTARGKFYLQTNWAAPFSVL